MIKPPGPPWNPHPELPSGQPQAGGPSLLRSQDSLPARVLVVDDDRAVRAAIAKALDRFGHQVLQARNGREAMQRLREGVDLILLDVAMPEMDGFTFLARLRSHPEWGRVPVIMVTGLAGTYDRLRAVRAGANDFISKPFDLAELKVRTDAQLSLKAAADAVQRYSEELERRVLERTRALAEALKREEIARARLRDAHLDTIRRLVLAAEFKDRATAAHIERIGRFSEVLGRAMGMPGEEVAVLSPACSMHDIGKIGIPDVILGKQGPLNRRERHTMQSHTVIGARILQGSLSPVLRMGTSIALTHHERWDGAGYPQGLAGEAIPLPGRICAVADVFDALTTERPYRRALDNDLVLDQMRVEEGGHFDPTALRALLRNREEIEEIQRTHRDRPPNGVEPLSPTGLRRS